MKYIIETTPKFENYFDFDYIDEMFYDERSVFQEQKKRIIIK